MPTASSPFDQSLHLCQAKGLVDERGLLIGTLPSFPEIPSDDCLQVKKSYFDEHSIVTKDGAHTFKLHIPSLTFALLAPSQIRCLPAYLIGECVNAHFDVKAAIDRIDPSLYHLLPKECLEGCDARNVVFRIPLCGEITKDQFFELRQRTILAFSHILNREYTYAKDNCFQNLVVVHDENKFLMVSFPVSDQIFHLIFYTQYDKDHLFLHNSVKLDPRQPALPIGDSYQALFDQLNRIIHSKGEFNFLAWFSFLSLQTSFYRSYEKDLEQKVLQIALEHLKSKEDPLQSCCDQLHKTAGDPFCLALSACRSMHNFGEAAFAERLYQASLPKFPKEGLPALFEKGDKIELHLALLQLFGILSGVQTTDDNFEKALQFTLQGHSLLIPLKLPQALRTLLEKGEGSIVERYFNYFGFNFSKVNLNWEWLAPGLQHESPPVRRLFLSLGVASVDHFIPELLSNLNDAEILEKYLQRFAPTFSCPAPWNPPVLAKALLMANHPPFSLKAFELIKDSPDIEDLIGKVPNPTDKIKLLKLNPSVSLIKLAFDALTATFNQNNGTPHLLHFLETVDSEPLGDIALPLLKIALSKLGLKPQTYALLEKINDKSIVEDFLREADLLQKGAGRLLAWETGIRLGLFEPDEQQEFLIRLLLQLMHQEMTEETIRLLPLVKQESIDKRVKGVITKLSNNPKHGSAILRGEIVRFIQNEKWSQAASKLQVLLDRDPENKEEVKQLIQKLPQIPQTLLLHPKIGLYFTPVELLPLYIAEKMFEKGLALFPTENEAINWQFIQSYDRAVPKITTYVLNLQDEVLVKQWITAHPPERLPDEELKKYVKLQLPGASPPHSHAHEQKDTRVLS